MNERILIVDDERDVCDVLKEALEYEKYQIDVATTGEDACQLIRERHYDLLLVDVRLTGSVSGLDVIKACQGITAIPRVFVISATPACLLEPLFEQHGITALIQGVLEKPADVNPDKVTKTVNDIIRKKGED